jgi:RNA polymerase sigma-70 factor (ECF subfamily)
VNEAELITAARQGNTAAWEELVPTYQEPVFRLAYLLLGDPDEAQDIAQETFIRAYHALPRFDVSHPLRPWLLRIASNLTKNRRRSLGRFFAALTRFAREPQPQPPDSADAELLWQAIRKLERHHQQALYLRYFMDMSEAEIAQTLDIAPGTVKSRLYRAHRSLRDVIVRDYPELQPESSINSNGET